ncbi:TPA: hypothetical protein DCG86_01170 [Candidatus Marinimicrobia bacterium]|nr:MAG: Uncharacterized protein XD77_0406 [Marinimicrobia bacterium 46_47]KUK90619.1 MAG: hypothetical protein XE04_1381 [Marinimicrobia bacterium 46_43]HAE86613.1 hypothetical protein [Candidatus Neomarinimicrobiota bacterium]HBY18215.1 hypothetical protein [Candidatus Neomarinimicrobiota bacterium]
MKEKLLISGCLAGLSCRYDGGSKPHLRLDDLKRRYDLIPVCPEQAGGLSTPRIPNELQVSAAEILSRRGKVKNQAGEDCTEHFIRGATETLKVVRLLEIKKALLKDGSPSCGKNRVYDGTFNGKSIPGRGITAEILHHEGIDVYSEGETDQLL